jgi:hypothetical protein
VVAVRTLVYPSVRRKLVTGLGWLFIAGAHTLESFLSFPSPEPEPGMPDWALP